MDIIKFDNVSFSYSHNGAYALKDINLSVKKGELLVIMGENGAGKTTFCKLINGIIPHVFQGRFSGTVFVDGGKTTELTVPQLAIKVGMVLDDPDTQVFTSTVLSEAAFGAENLCLPVREIKSRVEFALFAVGLGEFHERVPGTLSGGEKQRLSIAAALAMKAKILVLDEPLCRLDPQGVLEVMSTLEELKKKYQITIIMAEHNSAVAAEFADRICLLKNGKIAAIDSPKNIFSNGVLLEDKGIEPLVKRGSIESIFVNSVNTANTAKKPVIKISDFSYDYGGVSKSAAIQNINLTIYENDFVAIIGRNGCGKTTLLKNITGLLRPTSGDIFIHGKNTKSLHVSDISKEIGFVMQNPCNQLFTDSVYKEVAFALKNMRLPKKEIKSRVQKALRTVGLLPDAPTPQENLIMEEFPHSLSKTDRTKLVVACVLAMGPKIIIFDEVDACKDYREKIKIMNIAKELYTNGYTVIFVTHNISLAIDYAGRLIKMERNFIFFDGGRI